MMAASRSAASSSRKHTADLEKYGVRSLVLSQGQTSFTWSHSAGNGGRHRIQATWSRENVSPVYIELSLQDDKKNELTKLSIPEGDRAWNVIIIKASWLLQLQKSLKNGQVVEQYAVFLDASKQGRHRSINILNAIRSIVQQLPVNQVPFFNLGGRRPPIPQRSASSLIYYNLRQLAAPLPSATHKPWAIIYAATNMETRFNNHVATLRVRKFLVKLTGGRLGAERELDTLNSSKKMPLTMREILPAPTSDTGGEQESTAMSTPTRCGGCGGDKSPLGAGSIKNRLSRRTWVGCENAENCKSKNFWFHLKPECCDAELSRVGNKAYRWFCPACRDNVRGRGRLTDGKYIRAPRR